jgi:histidinol-phosphate aminotransferase
MPEFREKIKKMSVYKPPLEGRASKEYLLLDFNERTIEQSPKVKKFLKKFVDSGKLQVYPEYGDLTLKISQYAGVSDSQVMITNGCDQAIDIIFRAFVGRNDKVIIPTPSFAMYYQSAEIQGADILEPYYKEDSARARLLFPLEEVIDLINEEVKLIIICNPNNPTGTLVSTSDVEKILKKAKENDVAVLIDETYFEYPNQTRKDLIREYDNLFITRSFSKTFGLASIRAGYILSQEENIKELLKIRGPYDINMFAKTAISAVLDDLDYIRDYIKEVMEKSKPKLEEFFKKNKVKFYQGAANFLLIKPDNPENVADLLQSEGILVRPRKGPNIEGTIRVSVGTLKDTERFIKAYSKLL